MTFKQPEKIYKFRQFNEQTLSSLCHDQLYFAAPSTFNDPLDCKPSIVADSNIKELRDLLKELISRRVKSETLTSLKIAKVADNVAESHAEQVSIQYAENELANTQYQATNPDYEISIEEAEYTILKWDIQREILNQYDRGICCFSSCPKDPLLWSHYGDQHHGICIGYDTDRNPKPLLNKVNYDGGREVKTSLIVNAILHNDKASSNALDEQILLRKAGSWRYEKEWRLFDGVGLKDSPLALKDITFGLRCPTAVIHSIIKALEGRSENIDFYQISLTHGSFELKREPLNMYERCEFLPKTARSGIEIFGPKTDDE